METGGGDSFGLSFGTDDGGVTRRVKALGAAAPLALLPRNAPLWDGEYWDEYDLATIAVAAIDGVALAMGVGSGTTFDACVNFCAGQARRQQPTRPTDEHDAVGRRIVRLLRSDEPFSTVYLDHSSNPPVRRVHTYWLLYEQMGFDGEPYLRASQEAINVLIDALDIDVESAQIATEIQMRMLVDRGAYSQAATTAEIAMRLTVQYMEKVVSLLRDTRAGMVTAHAWGQERWDELASYLAHVHDRHAAAVELSTVLLDARDTLDDVDQRMSLNQIVQRLDLCRSRHMELQNYLMQVGDTMRAAQDARFARTATRAPRFDIEADLLVPILTERVGAAAKASDRIIDMLKAPRPDLMPTLSGLLGELLAVPDIDPGHDPIDNPEFEETDPVDWWTPYVDVADTILGSVRAVPRRLSELLEMADACVDADPDLHRGALRATVTHLAHMHRAPTYDIVVAGDALIAAASGERISLEGIDCDDLYLTRLEPAE